METTSEHALKPATSYTEVPTEGEPYLKGSRCAVCDTIYLGHRDDCGNCMVRGKMESIKLGTEGTLYNYTIVYRSYPGIRVPFISAIVDLKDGGTVKGNLLDIEPDPSKVRFGMPVKVVFRGAETANAEGAGYIAHFFVPA